MIRSFSLDGRLISFVPEAVQNDKSLNIFSADSMTLLVGANGSGKTRALAQIAELFDVFKTPKNDHKKSAGQFFNELTGDMDGLNETHAVYYTAIPFGIEMPPSSDRFVHIHPSSVENKTPPDLDVALPVLSEFGLSVTTTLKINATHKNILDILLSTINKYNSPIADDWIEPIRIKLKELDIQTEKASKERFTNRITFSEYWNSETFIYLKKFRESITKELSSILRCHIGEDFRLKLMAIGIARSKNKKTQDSFLQLLKDFGFELNKTPNRNQPAASKNFNAALEKLNKIAFIVNDLALKEKIYKVNTAQWSELAEINLSDIGKLSLTNLSSGGAALLEQFSALKRAIDKAPTTAKNLLLLIDEGDVYLHLSWQQKYVDFFDAMIKALWRERFDCIQVVMTTHSPVLMSDFPRDCIHRMTYANESQVETLNEEQTIASFAAPLELVIHQTGQSGTLGSFSARIIRNLVDDIKNGKYVAEYRLEMIDDAVIRRHLNQLKSSFNNQPATRND